MKRVPNFERPPHAVGRAELCGVSHLQGAANNLLLPAWPYSFHKGGSSGRVGDVVTCGQGTHVELNPSQAVAHFFHLRPVVTANILLSNTVLTRQ